MMWWENHFLTTKGRRLYLGGKDAREIAQKHGTPLFVYSRAQINANYQRLFKAFSTRTPLEIRICYAMKANANESLLKYLRSLGSWVDAVSPGEVDLALTAGFPGQRILFTGTSISREDLQHVFSHEGVVTNIDALEQLKTMAEVKKKAFKNKTMRVSVRWNPGIGRGFNPRVITAGKRSTDGTPIKFGVEEKKVMAAFQKAAECGFLPVGLHQHLGSGWIREDFKAVKEAVDRMLRMAARLERAGFVLEFLDFGGGFGPRYSQKQNIFPLEKYADHICRQIARSGLKIKAIALEPGKYMVADACVLLMRVEYIKESYGNLFACVNAGTFNTVPRPAIYPQASHPIVNCSNINTGRRRRLTIAGNLCETGDVFAKEILMPLPRSGDVLALLYAGAYCSSMASGFNLRDKPKEIII